MEMSEYLTVDESAVCMNMSVRYVRRLIAQRRIPFHKVGRSVRLKASDVIAHVESGRVEPIDREAIRRYLRGVA